MDKRTKQQEFYKYTLKKSTQHFKYCPLSWLLCAWVWGVEEDIVTEKISCLFFGIYKQW